MKFRVPVRNLTIPLTAIAATLAATGHAGTYSSDDPQDRQAMHDRQTMTNDWQSMQDEVIKASEVLDGDVTNGFNPLGDVRDLVLSNDGETVKYVLYEVPYPYSFYGGGEDGFVRFDNVGFEDQVYGDLEVRIDDEEKAMAKDRLRMTRGQADHRLVSNIIGEEISFGDDSREIENLLIDREDGDVTHVVIALNDDSVFNDQPRAIPMDRVEISSRGDISASVSMRDLEEMQRYAPEFLK